MKKKFDICLMNPPYGSNEMGDKDLHYKFVTKCNNISNKNIVVMPFRMFAATNNKFDIYKKEYDVCLNGVEEVNANDYFNIAVGSVAIYNFDNTHHSDIITILYKNGEEIKVKSLFDVSNISEYEQELLKYLDNKGNVNYTLVGSAGKNGRNEDFIKSQYIKKFNEDDILLLTNFSNGSGRPATFMSPNTGQIFKAKDAYKCDYAMIGYRNVIMTFDSFNGAENCKNALKRPLLRFGLAKLKDCQDMSKRARKYIPNIDWSDDRVKTDEGLLEVCGCPKDKIKEYVKYAKEYIKKVDDEYDNRKRK